MSSSLLYLHGFNSSPQSRKVTELREWLALHAPDVALEVPLLGFDPDTALDRACEAARRLEGQQWGVIGSSLGGFYAATVAERFAVPAVLVNPAVYPYRLLAGHLGMQHNPYTGEAYELTTAHMSALQSMEPAAPPERLMLLLQSGDETLDFREALARYPHAPAWVQAGGDHRFQAFERTLPAVMAFLLGRRITAVTPD